MDYIHYSYNYAESIMHFPQLVNGETGTFVWSEAPTSGKVEWRSTCLENGAPFLTLTGLMTMLQLSAANSVTSDLVYIANTYN